MICVRVSNDLKAMGFVLFAVLAANGGTVMAADVEYIAHQGEEALAPSHSAAAYRLAADHGLDYMKLDVQRTKDGVIVLQHDDNLKATTGVDWKIRKHTLDEIRSTCRYRAFKGYDRLYTNDTIQTLQEGLVQAKRMKGVWIDFKAFSPSLAEQVLDEVVKAGIAQDRIMVATWNVPALEYIRDRHPNIRRVAHTFIRPAEQGYATNHAKDKRFENVDQLLAELLATKERLGLYGFNLPAHIVRRGKLLYDTPDGLVRKLQENGLWISMWFVNDAETGNLCRRQGANAFVTNCKAHTGEVAAVSTNACAQLEIRGRWTPEECERFDAIVRASGVTTDHWQESFEWTKKLSNVEVVTDFVMYTK